MKIALVGASSRVTAFVSALKEKKDRCEIVGVMDTDPGKMKGFCDVADLDGLPMFTDFDRMCDSVRPDRVIITTMDCFHSHYIVKALDRGIGVISEKPLCINAQQCREILAAHARNPGVFAVTSHNARYTPHARKIHELISSGAIGKVRTASYTEMLDLCHGTSYFRRWNSEKKNSGGLQIHKASHHFDELNWYLGTHAAEVSAYGALISYGAKNSAFHGKTCHTCRLECPYRPEYDSDTEKTTERLYFRHAAPDSYTPDLCIFRPEIDIEDFLSVGIRYENGVYCSYSLTAQANYEGQNIVFDGETGRLECRTELYRIPGTKAGDFHDARAVSRVTLRLNRFGKGEPVEIPLETGSGSHDGADSRLFDDLFAEVPPADLPTLEDGVQAVIVGAAVNESLRTGGKVDVRKLLQGK